MMDNFPFDILQLPDGNGELYLGDSRSASWKWIRGGYTEITLSQRTEQGERANNGWTQQAEKAPGICRAWVERGEILSNFYDEHD